MRFYVVRVEIREAATGYAYPIVVHEFIGKDPHEAWGYHDAHLRADKFLSQCESQSLYQGQVRCRSSVTEGWRGR
jgi:hypothetical protein